MDFWQCSLDLPHVLLLLLLRLHSLHEPRSLPAERVHSLQLPAIFVRICIKNIKVMLVSITSPQRSKAFDGIAQNITSSAHMCTDCKR